MKFPPHPESLLPGILLSIFALVSSDYTHAQLPEGLSQVVQEFRADVSSVSSGESVPQNRETRKDLYSKWQERLDSLDYETLDVSGRIDWHLLRNHIAGSLDRDLHDIDRETNSLPFLPHLAPIEKLLEDRANRKPIDPEAAAAVLAPLADEIKALQKTIKKPGAGKKDANKDEDTKTDAVEITPEQAVIVARISDRLIGRLDSWNKAYSPYVPGFDWWVEKPHKTTNDALTAYSKFLREEIAKQKKDDKDAPLPGEPVGKYRLETGIKRNFLPYTIGELIAIGETEFKWCDDQMKKQSQTMGFGDDWKKALEQVKTERAKAGEQEKAIIDVAEAATAFVKERNLVTVPFLCERFWRTRMLSREAQKNIPYAAYSGGNVLVAYPTADMAHETKLMSMRGNGLNFIHITTPHELIPGHHLQKFQQKRYGAYRSAFSTPFYIEGWALYWELRLWELGWGTTPEERIGMLFWRMHRCARIIVTLKYHTGQMTAEEMVTFLVDRVGHEEFGATSEVRRYISDAYGPLYQAGYMLGGKQLYKLREELVETGTMTDLEFNDAVYNAVRYPSRWSALN